MSLHLLLSEDFSKQFYQANLMKWKYYKRIEIDNHLSWDYKNRLCKSLSFMENTTTYIMLMNNSAGLTFLSRPGERVIDIVLFASFSIYCFCWQLNWLHLSSTTLLPTNCFQHFTGSLQSITPRHHTDKHNATPPDIITKHYSWLICLISLQPAYQVQIGIYMDPAFSGWDTDR